MAPLTVCIDARILPALYGGVEQYVIGLSRSLLALPGR